MSNSNEALLPEGQDFIFVGPNKAEQLKRIADSLEKLVELQTPKEVKKPKTNRLSELATRRADIYVAGYTEGYDVANKIGEQVRFAFEGTDETAKKAGKSAGEALRKWHTGIERDAEKPVEDGWKPVDAETTEELLEVVKEEVKEVQAKKTVPEAEYKKLERKVKSLEQEVEDLKEVNRLLVEFQHRYNEDQN